MHAQSQQRITRAHPQPREQKDCSALPPTPHLSVCRACARAVERVSHFLLIAFSLNGIPQALA
eukprot:7775302-Alexandrium_andersonii.AAC.1